MGLSANDLEKIKSIVTSTFNESFLKMVAESVSTITEEKFKSIISDQKKQIDSMAEEIKNLKKNQEALRTSLDDSEQMRRNNNIRIFGIREKENEDLRKEVLDLFNKTMKTNIRETDLKKCYRIRPRVPSDKPSAVLVRFRNDAARRSVLKNRKQLRSPNNKTEVQIKEDLTKDRLMLLKTATKKYSSKYVWCLNGNIYLKKDGDVVRITKMSDLMI